MAQSEFPVQRQLTGAGLVDFHLVGNQSAKRHIDVVVAQDLPLARITGGGQLQ